MLKLLNAVLSQSTKKENQKNGYDKYSQSHFAYPTISIINVVLEMSKLNILAPEKVVLISPNSFVPAIYKGFTHTNKRTCIKHQMPLQINIKLTFVFGFTLLFLWLSNSI